ncbi:MAG TPA: aldo/keto reductase [Stellaceae bacterium]|nr:aldo/keto reductase [Stellaceae bacterium]
MAVFLPGNATPTTLLGYGCSQLMGRHGERASLALLDAAYDCGIRHFDVAPSYGFGAAERTLGKALRGKRDSVTLTTKFGLRPPRHQTLVAAARNLARPLVKLLPGVRRRLARTSGALVSRARFVPEELTRSLDASLAALRTDHIDVLLLHEATVDDLDDALLGALESCVSAGKIAAFGIGSEAAAAGAVWHADRRFCPVLQFEWSVLSAAPPDYHGSFVITHRALSQSFTALTAWLGTNPAIVRSWSDELNMDVSAPGVLSRLMLTAARTANPTGIMLFSSSSTEHIRRNAAFLSEGPQPGPGTAFMRLVARDARLLSQRELTPDLVDADRP